MDKDWYLNAIDAVEGPELDTYRAIKSAYWKSRSDKEVVYQYPPSFSGISFVVPSRDEEGYDTILVQIDPETEEMIPDTAIATDNFMDEVSAHEFLYRETRGIYNYCEKGKYSEHYQDFLRPSLYRKIHI